MIEYGIWLSRERRRSDQCVSRSLPGQFSPLQFPLCEESEIHLFGNTTALPFVSESFADFDGLDSTGDPCFRVSKTSIISDRLIYAALGINGLVDTFSAATLGMKGISATSVHLDFPYSATNFNRLHFVTTSLPSITSLFFNTFRQFPVPS